MSRRTRKSRTERVAKALPSGAMVVGSLADRAQATGGRLVPEGAPATSPPPDPGPLPVPTAGAPIRFQFPYASNQVLTPRRDLTPFQQLRAFADALDVARICIETRKDQMCSLGWDIGPRDRQGLSDSQERALEPKIRQAREFFLRPDKKRDFSTWLRMAIEEVLVIDALSIYRRRTRGGQLYSLEVKDGATFVPLLAPDGDTPTAPAVAYRQIINGQPVIGGDCTTDDLLYRPRTVRTWTPYGLSPTEAVLLTINAALKRQLFNLAYFTEGNVPEGLLDGPPGANAEQLHQLQEYFDDFLTTNPTGRRRVKLVPNGTAKTLTQFKDAIATFTTEWDTWIVKIVCAAFAVPPQEIGFTADVNKSTGAQQENISYRRGIKPLGAFLKCIFDEVLAFDLGLSELQWVWTGGEQEDKKLQAEVDEIEIRSSVSSVDEIRKRQGKDAIGLGPTIMTPAGPMLVEDFLDGGKPLAADSSAENAPEPPPQPVGALPGSENSLPAGKPNPDKPAGKKPAANRQKSADEDVDLRRWRTSAIKRAKDGRPVARAFVSDAIRPELAASIATSLTAIEKSRSQAVSRGETFDAVAAVVVAFDAAVAKAATASEQRTLTSAERRQAKAVKAVMRDHFSAEGAALVDYLEENL